MRIEARGPATLAQQLEKVDAPLFTQTVPGKPGAPAVFLTGYGGTPDDSMGPPLAAALGRAGVALDITTPWIEPRVKRGGEVKAFGRTTLSFQLAQIQKLAEQTDGKLTLIGHSFGGLGARIYATLHPEKVERVVLLMPGEGVAHRTARDFGIESDDPDEIQQGLLQVVKEAEGALAEAKRKGDEKAIAELTEQINWVTMCADIVGYDEDAPISKLKVPALLVRGGGDTNLSPAMVMSVAREAVDAEVKTVVVPGAGHMLEAETPAQVRGNYDLVAKAIGAFLAPKEIERDEFANQAAPAAKAEHHEAVPQADDDALFATRNRSH